MTQEQIIEGNKLIAEFMNLNDSEDFGKLYFEPIQMIYHESWNWTMPVVKKIYESYFDRHTAIAEALNEVDLAGLWVSVVNFIKFWNDPMETKYLFADLPQWAADHVMSQNNYISVTLNK